MPVFLFASEPEEVQILDYVIEQIKKDYYKDVPTKKLIAGALFGLMKTLDAYSSYLPPDIYKSYASLNRGAINVLGLELIEKAGEIHVLTPLDGSSAQKAGIKAGDVITHIDGGKLQPFVSREFVINKIRHKADISLKVRRSGKVIKVTLKKAAIYLDPVRFDKIDNILYIKVIYFGQGLTKLVRDKIETETFQGIIFDVRNNPGGQFKEGVDLAGLFLAELPVVFVKGRNSDSNKLFISEKNSLADGQDIVILVNGNTASSSEIFAGALKDHSRATLIGKKTFGKGSIQRVLHLGELGGIKMTVARFFTPKGNVIHEKGILPDIEVQDPDDVPASYAFDPKKSIEIDPQFKKGVQYLKDKYRHD